MGKKNFKNEAVKGQQRQADIAKAERPFKIEQLKNQIFNAENMLVENDDKILTYDINIKQKSNKIRHVKMAQEVVLSGDNNLKLNPEYRYEKDEDWVDVDKKIRSETDELMLWMLNHEIQISERKKALLVEQNERVKDQIAKWKSELWSLADEN